MDWSPEAVEVFTRLNARGVASTRDAVQTEYGGVGITAVSAYMVAAYFIRHHWDVLTRDECERVLSDVGAAGTSFVASG